MPIGELSSIVQTLLTWLISKWEFIASGVAVTALILWICARTGSTHVLNKRLWRLVLGKHEIKSPALSAFAEQRDDLMHFRTLTSLKRVLWALGVKRSEHDNVDPGRTHGPIQTVEADALVVRACLRLRQILSDSTSARAVALSVHVNALVSLAMRGLTDQDRRTAAQLVTALGFRSWKSARLRDRSPHAQLELFGSVLT